MSTADELEVRHEEADGRGAFFIERDGVRLALQTYVRTGLASVVIDHTEVEPPLQGHGVARHLLDVAVAWARATRTRVGATCTYARAQFEKDPSIRDVFDA